jgi:biotin transporter BioY
VVGLTAAAFAVGWLSERRSWDRHRASAARLALIGIALMYVLGFVWLEVAALLKRETQAPSGVLPSILILVITVTVVAFALPRAWVAAASMKRAQSESTPEAVPVQTEPNETAHPRSPQ